MNGGELPQWLQEALWDFEHASKVSKPYECLSIITQCHKDSQDDTVAPLKNSYSQKEELKTILKAMH